MARVRFSSEPEGLDCSEDQESTRIIDVSFGFLKCGSSYLTRLELSKHGLHPPITFSSLSESLHCELVVKAIDDEIELVLVAKYPGKYSETIVCEANDSTIRKVHVKANVLPGKMGTPALKENIFCIAKASEIADSSDQNEL